MRGQLYSVALSSHYSEIFELQRLTNQNQVFYRALCWRCMFNDLSL